jgi:2-polyprenyl-6-methoxyphenol hydroxylase-like FAD-dependent oxidoreductase
VDDTALSRQQIASGNTSAWKAALLTRLGNDQTPAASIVRAAHQVLVTNAYDLPNLRRWHRDRLLLIGDAAHAASPATGQGASTALEDAVILAKSLRDKPNPGSAFLAYEQLRHDRVQANITRSGQISARNRLDSPPLSPADQPAAGPPQEIHTQLEWNTPLT